MSGFSNLQERIKIKNMIGYLLYGTEDVEIDEKNTYQTRLDNAYEKIVDALERLFPNVSRENENLNSAIADFSIIQSEVYLEMGVIIGFQLYQNLEKEYSDMDESSLQNIVKILLDKRTGMEKKDAGR